MQNSRIPCECGAISPKDEVENSEFGNFGNLREYFFEVSSPLMIPKTENSEMKTLGFSLRHFDQTPRFSIFEFSVWGIVQKRNLGVGKNSEFDQNTLKDYTLIN